MISLSIGEVPVGVSVLSDTYGKIEEAVTGMCRGFEGDGEEADTRLSITPLPDVSLDRVYRRNGRFEESRKRIEARFPCIPLERGKSGSIPGRMAFWRMKKKGLPPVPELPEEDGRQRVVLVPGGDFILSVDMEEDTAWAVMTGKGTPGYGVTGMFIVQALVSMLLGDRDGAMFHGSAVNLNGKGHLFLGISGAGKSTVARRFSRDLIISDDGVVCRRVGGRFLLFPTPFTQVRNTRPVGVGGVPLERMYFLVKDERDVFAPVSPGAALVKILTSHIHFFRFLDDEGAMRVFRLIEDLVKSVSVRDFHFTRTFDPDIVITEG